MGLAIPLIPRRRIPAYMSYARAFDFAAGAYWVDGIRYQSIADVPGYACNRSGEVSYLGVIPAQAYGPNLVLQGNGSSGSVNAWQATGGYFGGNDDGLISEVGGKLRLVQQTFGVTFSQPVATVLGRTYQITGEKPNGAAIIVGSVLDYAGGPYNLYNSNANDFSATSVNTTVIAVDAESWVSLGNNSINPADFDNIVFREVIQPDVVETFAAHVPAIVPGKGYHAYRGLTNHLLVSQQAQNWSSYALAVNTDMALAPDGTMSADKLVPHNNNDQHSNYQSDTGLPTGAIGSCTFTRFYKAAGYGFATIGLISNNMEGVRYWINLATGQVSSFTTYGGGLVSHACYTEVLGNGWIRATIVGAPLGTMTDLYGYTEPAPADGVLVFPGNNVDGILVWQGQLYHAALPDGGPIIPTIGSTITVGASVLTLGDVPTSADQLFLFSFKMPQWPGSADRIAQWYDAGGNSIILYVGGNGLLVANISGTETLIPGIAVGTDIKVIMRRLGGNWRHGSIINGVLTWAAAPEAAGAFPAFGASTALRVGHYEAGSQPNAQIKFVGRKLGSFATDAAVIAVAAEIA